MGIDPQSDAPLPAGSEDTAVRVLVPGSGVADRTLAGPADLVLEDGTSLAVDAELPATLPFGYHQLRPRDGGAPTLLIVSPGRCFLPDDLRVWGFAAQLYATRSRDSWGIGDLADLARLGRWTRSLGGGALMVNPLTAPTPVAPIEPSPYYPSSRRFRNPLYLHIEDIPGWNELPAADRDRLGNAGRALNAGPRIDRDAIFRIKLEALEALYAGFDGDATASTRSAPSRATALTEFTVYCALAEQHGKDWRRWPDGYRRPDGADVAALPRRQSGRASAFTPGCSGGWTNSWRARRRRSPSSTTCPSGSTSRAPTPGAGRTSWPPACRSARRPTSSTPPARTGG